MSHPLFHFLGITVNETLQITRGHYIIIRVSISGICMCITNHYCLLQLYFSFLEANCILRCYFAKLKRMILS